MSSSSQKNESAKCLLKVLCKKIEETFLGVNLMAKQEQEKKIDVVSTDKG